MRKHLSRLAFFLFAITIAGTASAATITQSGGGGALPDLSTVTFDIVIGSSGTVSDVTVRFDITHPQVGDLRVSITNVAGGITQDLVYRLGGDTYNRNYGGEYVFNDGFTTGTYSGNIWTAANAVVGGTNGVVPVGNYFASTTTGTPVDLSAAFGGTEAAGTWRLTIQDYRSSNTGTLNGWGLTIETDDSTPPPTPTVPEPSTYILFGIGLGALASLRRRR